jgi:hypothetical protein
MTPVDVIVIVFVIVPGLKKPWLFLVFDGKYVFFYCKNEGF